MLYLSCLPCGDIGECNVKPEAKIYTIDNHKQHNHESEACSPFCICSCCATSAYYTPFTKYLVSKVVFQSEKYPLYNVAINAEAHYSIWQPPKIS